jgi:hypothetical protein
MNIPKYTVIQYIRNKNRIPLGVVVAIKSADGYNLGYSLCRKGDRFNKRMALNIAIGRANLNGSNATDKQHRYNVSLHHSTLPYAISKMMPTFVERCQKYYKV